MLVIATLTTVTVVTTAAAAATSPSLLESLPYFSIDRGAFVQGFCFLVFFNYQGINHFVSFLGLSPKAPELGVVQQWKCVVSQLWWLEVSNQRCLLFAMARGEILFVSSSPCCWQASLVDAQPTAVLTSVVTRPSFDSGSSHCLSSVHVHFCVQMYLWGQQSYWVRTHPKDRILTNHISRNPVSNRGHILRS